MFTRHGPTYIGVLQNVAYLTGIGVRYLTPRNVSFPQVHYHAKFDIYSSNTVGKNWGGGTENFWFPCVWDAVKVVQ